MFGGALLGAGLVMRAQVALAHHSREEVQSVFFLWRGIGQLTFVFQDNTTKMALWMNEIPDEVLAESDRAAWALVIVGAVIALTAAFFRSKTPTTKR